LHEESRERTGEREEREVAGCRWSEERDDAAQPTEEVVVSLAQRDFRRF
jgi:hypothetical protein